MSFMIAFTRSLQLRSAVVAMALGSLAGCGGGGGDGGGTFGVDVIVPVQQPVVAPLTLLLTRVGPEAIEVDWSDDPRAANFSVLRDGFVLTTVSSLSLIDTLVFFDNTYCYQVVGHDAAGQLVAASSTGCITILP